MRGPLLIVVAIIVLSQNAAGQESRPALPPAPPPPGTVAVEDPADAMKSHLAIDIPQVIVPSDVERYCRMLGLSEEQRTAFERLYIAYREECDKLNREQMPPIARLSLKCGSGMPDTHDWDWFEDYEEFWARERAYMKEQFRREDAIFEQLVPILSEQQIPKLPRVQMHRQRSRCSMYSMIPGGRLDLTELLEKSHLPEEIMEAVDPTLAEYEAALTPAVLKAHRIHARQMVELVRSDVALQFDAAGSKLDQRTFAERFGATQEQREKLLDLWFRAQKQIAEVNAQFAPRILDLIPEPHRTAVHDDYLSFMHSYVYPDNCDPKDLFDEIVKAERLDPDLRDALQAMWGIYRQSYDSLTRQIIEAVDKSNEQMARTFTGLPESASPQWKLRAERWDKGFEFMDSVLKQLPPELQATFAPRVASYKKRCESPRAMAEHRWVPPPQYQPERPAPK